MDWLLILFSFQSKRRMSIVVKLGGALTPTSSQKASVNER